MKTKNTTGKVKALLASLLCLAISQTPHFASAEGASSGSGNGDVSFAVAVEQMREAHANMTDQQILLKLFNESTTRIPEINYKQIFGTDTSQVSVFEGNILSAPLDQIRNVVEVDHSAVAKLVSPTPDIVLSKRTENLGPLLGKERVVESVRFGYDNNNFRRYISRSASSLLITTSINLENKTWVEIRAYDAKTAIFITRPLEVGFAGMKCLTFGTNKWDGGNNLIAPYTCSVGYIWVD